MASPTRYTAQDFHRGAEIHRNNPCETHDAQWMLEQAADTEAALVKLTTYIQSAASSTIFGEALNKLRELGLERSR